MTGRGRSGAVVSFALAAGLALASVVMGAGAAQGLPRTVPLRVSFADLLPGDSRSTSWPVQMPTDSMISAASVHADGPGEVRWTVGLCPVGGGVCVDLLTAGVGTPVPEGEYLVRVGLSVGELKPGQAQTLEGRYTFVEAGAELAATGGSVLLLASAALAAGVLGVLFLLVARRRRDQDAADALATEAIR